MTQVGTDTDIPWGLDTLPDGSVLYARRDAHDVIRLDPATGAKTNVGTVPNVQSTDGEGGLLGLALSPTFASDQWVYLMHTSPTDNRIVRIKLVNNALVTSTEQVLLSGILRNKFHDGGRLRFGPDGKLYAATGDAQNGDNAQNTSNLAGKILRLNPDGTVPSDNPFGNYVWSYGHRNPQGLAFDSQGRLWEQEFGNSVMDETNLIVKGGNYGWPACEGTSRHVRDRGVHRPQADLPDVRGVVLRHRDRARRALRGLRARRPHVPRGHQRDLADQRADLLQRDLRPAADRRARARRRAVADHDDDRGQGQRPEQQQRADLPGHARGLIRWVTSCGAASAASRRAGPRTGRRPPPARPVSRPRRCGRPR